MSDQSPLLGLAGLFQRATTPSAAPSAPAAPRSPRAMNSPGEHGMGANFFSLLRNRNPAPATAKTPGLGVPMLGSSLSARDKLNRIFGGDR